MNDHRHEHDDLVQVLVAQRDQAMNSLALADAEIARLRRLAATQEQELDTLRKDSAARPSS